MQIEGRKNGTRNGRSRRREVKVQQYDVVLDGRTYRVVPDRFEVLHNNLRVPAIQASSILQKLRASGQLH